MGRFFTSTQIYNPKQLDRDGFKADFCKKMKKEGYEVCEAVCAELSYVLAFADNCKWVTISSEAYEQGNRTSRADTARIAKMLGTYCVNTIVIDSDCAMLDLYDDKGKKADTLVMGRADDYLGDDIPAPAKAVWEKFLSADSTWEKFISVVQGDYVFVEDGLSELAPVIGMDGGNILFEYEDADESNENFCYLSFRKASSKKEKKLTLNAAFKQIIGEALEPYGFKIIKGRHPYIVRVINNEILHIITFCPESPEYPEDKAFAIMCGVATIYRKKITFDLSPKENHEWLDYMSSFYTALTHENDSEILGQLYKSCFYSDKADSLTSVLTANSESIIKYVLPIMDKIKDIDSCLDYMQEFMMPCNTKKCAKICTYYPDEDESFLYFLSEKIKKNPPDFLNSFLNDNEFHSWVMCDIEKRKIFNTEILKSYGIDFEKPQPKKEKKLTINAAFKQVFGELLEPMGFKLVKSKHPYFVRVVNGEILQVITIVSRPDKRFEILGGIATVYRQSLSLNLNPQMNESWLIGNFYYYQQLDITNEKRKYSSNEIYEFYGADLLEKEMKRAFTATKKIILDIFDKVNSLEKCVEFYNFFGMDIRIHHKDDFGNSYPINYYNEGLLIIKTMNLEQYSSLMDKYKEITINRRKKQITNGGIPYERLMNEQEVFKNQKINEYKDLLDDKDWLATVDIELNNRRNHNIRLLEEYGLI